MTDTYPGLVEHRPRETKDDQHGNKRVSYVTDCILATVQIVSKLKISIMTIEIIGMPPSNTKALENTSPPPA